MSEGRAIAEAFHPSQYIRDELEARGWSLDDLALRMGGDFGVNRLALDFYFELGPTEPDMRIGLQSAAQLGIAFSVSPALFLNLEKAWLASSPRQEASAEDAA